MNDSEKVEAIKKTLSHNLDYKKLIRQYVGFIQDIVDDKMTMTEVDDYIKVLIRDHNWRHRHHWKLLKTSFQYTHYLYWIYIKNIKLHEKIKTN